MTSHDPAELDDRTALATHLAEKAAGRTGIPLDALDEALDRIDAEILEGDCWLTCVAGRGLFPA